MKRYPVISALICFMLVNVAIVGYVYYDLNCYTPMQDEKYKQVVSKKKAPKISVYYDNIGYQNVKILNIHKAAYLFDLIKNKPGYALYGIRYQLDEVEHLFYIDLSTNDLQHIIDGKPVTRYTWKNKTINDLEKAMVTGNFGKSVKELF